MAAPPEKPARKGSAFLSGAASGVVTSVLLQPFDVVKTRLQAHVASGGSRHGGMVAIARGVAQKEGVRALWSGVGPACIRVGGGAGLYFLCLSTAQEALAKRWPPDAEGNKPVGAELRTFVLGATSRSVAAIVFCPVTVVKTRMEYAAVSGVSYRNTAHALATIARQERLRGLFSGLGPTLLRDAPYSGLYLLLYTSLRGLLDDSGHASPGLSFLAGAAAGSVATLVTHPPDVLRTRCQLRRASQATGLPAVTLQGIVRQEGVLALFSGIAPRIARRTLQQAITWTMFEALYGGSLVGK